MPSPRKEYGEGSRFEHTATHDLYIISFEMSDYLTDLFFAFDRARSCHNGKGV